MASLTTNSQSGSAAPRFHRCVARQPILTANEKVFGYELLFRDGVDDYMDGSNPDAASRSTLDTSLLVGLNVLCDGRTAFINCTRDVLLRDYITLLPAEQTAVEVLEDVPPDDLVFAACERLAGAGYTIVMDGFTAHDPRERLAPLAGIIKVDFRDVPIAEAKSLIGRYSSRSMMLAEKVETREEFTAARNAGFTLFQGFFFRKPELMMAREIPANQVNYLRMLKTISQTELDSRELETMIKSEASLCYRLLRYLNSAHFTFAREIQSVRHALTILGEREVRRWIRMVITLGVAESKPSDLVLSAMVRARLCELLGARVPHGDHDVFLVGLLSMMDAILELPIGVILEGIHLDREMKAVLLGEKGRLSPLYGLMLAQESADWERVSSIAKDLKLDEAFVAECHWKAMQWAREMTTAG